MFAVIQTGGKQYKVVVGDTIRVELLADLTDGGSVTFDQVMLVSEEDGSGLQLGAPIVPGATVTATVKTAAGRARKVDVRKFKNKTRQFKRYGHRQPYTEVTIEKITA